MIRSFADSETAKVFRGVPSRKLPLDIQRTAQRKLIYLDETEDLRELANVPGNRFKALSGDRSGQYSIRVNDQYRICFRWLDRGAHDVQITDYH